MLTCFTSDKSQKIIPITVLSQETLPQWLSQQTPLTRQWLAATQFNQEPNQVRLLPNSTGEIERVIYCVEDKKNNWRLGHLPFYLPPGVYQLDQTNEDDAIAWGLGAYQFTRYKQAKRQAAILYLPASLLSSITPIIESLYFVRDCINTPTEEMGPSELAVLASSLAKQYGAIFRECVGDNLLKENYPLIHAVGRASDDPPRLLDLRWGNAKHPKVTLVGKGVCFDTGGLDIKSSSHMLLMKKDMAGAAHVLGLARMIMSLKLPICLRVLIPAVENVISGNAYRPGDILKSRKGLTVEIGNTDAEGRVILADALTEAASENPDLLIDISTLTGAARIALGTDLPAIFSHHDELVQAVIKEGEQCNDLMWRLPLYAPYREYLNSPIADINNNASEPYGGAITAALFLNDFVPTTIPWLHIDMMAWNLRTRPGRPQGGEAMTLRALLAYLQYLSA